jgi:ABC-type lipoprotein export system ATPase subunit
MSRDFLKTIFKDLTEKVIVLSVIGPQSSGKSTLLNFLFGCDFLTSTGRCTRGIYGTYIRL